MHTLLDLGPAFLVAMVGVMLLILAAFGRPVATHPTCRNCRADLRPVAGVPEATCPGCSRRRDRRGVRWRPYPWRWRFLAVGLALVTAGLAFGALTRAQTRLGLRLSDAFVDDVALANDIAGQLGVATGFNGWDASFDVMSRLVVAGRVSPEAAAILERALRPLLPPSLHRFSGPEGRLAELWLLATGLGSPELFEPAMFSRQPSSEMMEVRLSGRVVRQRLWIHGFESPPLESIATVRSITAIEIAGRSFPVSVVVSDGLPIAIDLPAEAEAMLADAGGRIRWTEHVGLFPPAVARAIVADGLADPARWPSCGYRIDLESGSGSEP